MGRRHSDKRNAKASRPAQGAGRRAPPSVRLRRRPDEDAWELVHPRCAVERTDDLDEVQKMIGAGEFEVATDELRWLLDGCADFLAAHRTLGELAMLGGDVPLARGHFGYAYQLGVKALETEGFPAPLPYRLESNRAFFEAGKGLAWCFTQLGKPELKREVIERLLACDPADPLGLGDLDAQVPPGESQV